MNRFYMAATDVLLKHDALIDKLIGDEVMALFFRGVAGNDYVGKAAEAGVDLLKAVGNEQGQVPWLPLAVAVHSGPAFVGNVGSGDVVDFTALGDTVNAAARLQHEGAPGQLVISDAVVAACRGKFDALERRVVEVRGKDEPLGIRVLDLAGRNGV
jgi:adenylate cyclase